MASLLWRLFRKLPATSSQRAIIDQLSDVPVNSIRMGKSGDNTEAGKTRGDYNGMEKSWIKWEVDNRLQVVRGRVIPVPQMKNGMVD
jgi:hypothetical protein